MTRRQKREARGYIAPPAAPRVEEHEARFRPLKIKRNLWARKHAKAINRSHPAALA